MSPERNRGLMGSVVALEAKLRSAAEDRLMITDRPREERVCALFGEDSIERVDHRLARAVVGPERHPWRTTLDQIMAGLKVSVYVSAPKGIDRLLGIADQVEPSADARGSLLIGGKRPALRGLLLWRENLTKDLPLERVCILKFIDERIAELIS